jgi:hypothetical protein
MLGNWNRINASGGKADSEKNELVFVYAAFAGVAVLTFHWIGEGEFSAVLTLSAVFQCLAFCLLGTHAFKTGNFQGISGKSLQLEAIALMCRLSATVQVEGYVPSDSTGDYLYQCFDVLSLALVLVLLYRVMKVQDKSYEVDADTLPTLPFVGGSLVLACLLHGIMMKYRIFDILWMMGLFVGAVAVVPQLWLMTHSSASTPALASHFIAVMALSRILNGTYMWHAAQEIDCLPWIGTCGKDDMYCGTHAGYATLAAQALHLLLLTDFAYFYIKNLTTQGLRAPLDLPQGIEV